AGLPLMPARTFSPMARIAMALVFLKPSRIRWSIGFIPSVNNRRAYENDRLCYNDHFLREQVDRVRPEDNLLGSGNNHHQCAFAGTKIIIFVPAMIVLKPEITISMTTKTASVSDLTATMANKTATIERLCNYLKSRRLNGHRKDRYDDIDNYL